MLDTEKEASGKTTPPLRMTLNTIGNARKTFSRIIRKYEKGEMTTEKAKTLTYLFSTYINIFKVEAELNINSRIEEIEKVLNVHNK